MLSKINDFRSDMSQLYDNRINRNPDVELLEKKLTLSERAKSLILEILAVLGVILTRGNQDWKNASKELFAQVRTGVVYFPIIPAPSDDLTYRSSEPGDYLEASGKANRSKDDLPLSIWDPTSKTSRPAHTPPAMPNEEQIAKIAAELSSVDRHHSFGINEGDILRFLHRGGRIMLLEEGQQIPLRRNERYVVGCTSGVNRSQTHAAYMIRNGLKVDAILAGGDSAFNPTADFATVSGVYMHMDDQIAFETHFGFSKISQLGSDFNHGIQSDFDNAQVINDAKDFYADYINTLEPTHFIAYAMSGPSVLKRLLDSNKPSLEGFTLTFINWPDQIVHTTREDVAPCSQEAYRLFEEKIAAHFPIID